MLMKGTKFIFSPSSFRAPRSGFPRFQWLTDLSTAPRIKCDPSPDRGIDNSALSAQMDLTLFVYTRQHRVRFFLVESKSCFHAGDFVARRGAIASICRRARMESQSVVKLGQWARVDDKSNRSRSACGNATCGTFQHFQIAPGRDPAQRVCQ